MIKFIHRDFEKSQFQYFKNGQSSWKMPMKETLQRKVGFSRFTTKVKSYQIDSFQYFRVYIACIQALEESTRPNSNKNFF